MRKTPLKSARRQACRRHGQTSGLPTPPTGEQKQKKRTFDVLPKPDKLIRYRHILIEEQSWICGIGFLAGASLKARRAKVEAQSC
jgi:hypothetical protein